jgi:uncharacterized protein
MHTALIIKATRHCNLRCTYCNDWRVGRGQTMSYSVMLAMTARALQDPLHDSVDFVWHGGEPTLLGRSFFAKAIHAQARLRRPNQAITNSLQTNATRLDDDWARFLRDNRFAVSVSLDGPAFIHDGQRRYRSGRSSFADVRRGIDVLRHHGIPVSALLVVDRQTLDLGPDVVFDFFVDQGVGSFGLLAAKPKNEPSAGPNHPSKHYVRPAEMGRFLSRLFDRWVAHGDPALRVREFDALLKRIVGRSAPTCVLAGHCFGSYFLIEPNGEAAHCDLFLGDPAYTFGSIVSDTFADLRSSPAMKLLRTENRAALETMRDCPNFAICNGWCPHERYTAFRHDPEFSRSCCGLGGLIDHIRARVGSRAEAGCAQRQSLPA